MKKLLFIVAAIVFLSSCNPKQAWQKRSIDSKEKILMKQAEKGKVDTTAVKDLLNAYESYATTYPSDTMGANYLFRAADFYRYMRKPMRSVELYGKIYELYPTFEKRPYALCLQGYLYENDVMNIDSAKAKYQQFLTAYPNHPMARDVKITMEHLGKTPDQLMQEIESKRQADSLATSNSGK